MEKYIGDDKVILNLTGLRFVQKTDPLYMGSGYSLSWEYKGSKGSARYEKKEDRDAMYDKVQKALLEKARETPKLDGFPPG